MPLSLVAICLLGAVAMALRGDPFHNYLVARCAAQFRQAGFNVDLEHPLQLPDGRIDFVDILAESRTIRLVCEIETTSRYVRVNALKAIATGLPLWIVVPTRKLETDVRHLLDLKGARPFGERAIWILLPDQLSQAISNCFSTFLSANGERKTKQERSGQKGGPPCRSDGQM
jgi:hypothetical protein